MKTRHRLMGTLLPLVVLSSLQAQVLLGNLSSSNDGSSTGLHDGGAKAVSFTMGASDWNITGVVLRLSNYQSANYTPSVGFYTDVANAPGALVGALFSDPLSVLDAVANFTFTPTSAVTLSSGVKYWLKVSESAPGTLLWMASSPSQTPTSPDSAATYGSYRVYPSATKVWVNSTTLNSMKIQGTPVPEPAAFALIAGLGLAGFVAVRHTRKP